MKSPFPSNQFYFIYLGMSIQTLVRLELQKSKIQSDVDPIIIGIGCEFAVAFGRKIALLGYVLQFGSSSITEYIGD